jgi:hypothetical protein
MTSITFVVDEIMTMLVVNDHEVGFNIAEDVLRRQRRRYPACCHGVGIVYPRPVHVFHGDRAVDMPQTIGHKLHIVTTFNRHEELATN